MHPASVLMVLEEVALQIDRHTLLWRRADASKKVVRRAESISDYLQRRRGWRQVPMEF